MMGKVGIYIIALIAISSCTKADQDKKPISSEKITLKKIKSWKSWDDQQSYMKGEIIKEFESNKKSPENPYSFLTEIEIKQLSDCAAKEQMEMVKKSCSFNKWKKLTIDENAMKRAVATQDKCWQEMLLANSRAPIVLEDCIQKVIKK